MSDKIICPLCDSEDNLLIETLKVSDLAWLFRFLRESVDDEFGSYDSVSFYTCNSCKLKFFNPAPMGSAKIYDILQGFDWYYHESKDEFDLAVKYITDDASVLDIGSGSGRFSKSLKNNSYTGLDLSEKASVTAKADGINVLNEKIEIHSVNNKNKYDVVSAFQVMENVIDLKSFITSSLSCLKTEGLFIISLPSDDSFISSVRNGVMNLPPLHVTRWPDKTFEVLASKYNLELLTLEHEMLDDRHKDFYSCTVAFMAINKLLNRKYKLLDTSLTGRFIGLFALLLGKFYSLGLNKEMLPFGHSITAVYQKKG